MEFYSRTFSCYFLLRYKMARLIVPCFPVLFDLKMSLASTGFHFQ